MSALHAVLDVLYSMSRWIAGSLADTLVRATLEGSLLLLAVTLLLRAFPRVPAAARAAMWWLATARLVLALAPHVPLQVLPNESEWSAPRAWLAAREATQAVATRVDRGLTEVGVGSGRGIQRDLGSLSVSAVSAVRRAVPGARTLDYPNASVVVFEALRAALLLLWFTGVLFLSLRLFLEQLRMNARWNRATPLANGEFAGELQAMAARQGLAGRVEIRVVPEGDSPCTFGFWPARVLLPAASLSRADDARLALAHELAHVRRADALLGWLPALAQVVFWFHPLMAWATREYVQSREEACDALALEITGASPREYGELLLRYGVHAAAPSAAVASFGSRTANGLKRRLRGLQHRQRPNVLVRTLTLVLLAIATVAVVPVQVVARAGSRTTRIATESIVRDGVAVKNSRSISVDSDEFSYLFLKRGSAHTMGMLNMSDLSVLKRVRERYDDDLWLVRLGRDSYIVRDPATRARAEAIVEPMERMDAELEPLEESLRGVAEQTAKLERLSVENEELMNRVEERYAQLEGLRESLSERRASTAEVDRQLREVEAQHVKLTNHMKKSEKLLADLEQLRDERECSMEAKHEDHERQHAAIVVELEDLAREAVARGLAERFR